ncbi:MAG: hypothetical protein IPK69_09370 [Phycisphaerales bacterium]|nr:MAG: hypothetical protein IPK69_09370 [Phycisphaerales bacterium]
MEQPSTAPSPMMKFFLPGLAIGFVVGALIGAFGAPMLFESSGIEGVKPPADTRPTTKPTGSNREALPIEPTTPTETTPVSGAGSTPSENPAPSTTHTP